MDPRDKQSLAEFAQRTKTGPEDSIWNYFFIGSIGCALERNRPDAVVGVVVSVVKSYLKGIPKIRLVQSLGKSSFKTGPKWLFPKLALSTAPG